MSDNKNKDEKPRGFNMSSLRTDKTKDVEGIWCDHEDGLSLLIARSGNPNAKAYRNKLLKKNRYKVDQGDLKVIEDIAHQVIAKHILLGWKNLQDVDTKGKTIDVPYSSETALKYLRELDKFSDIVSNYANDFDSYVTSNQEQEAKN